MINGSLPGWSKVEWGLGLGEDSTVLELGKEGATHYCTLCESPSPAGEDLHL